MRSSDEQTGSVFSHVSREAWLTVLRNHGPVVILLTLAGTMAIAMGFVGDSAGVSGAKRGTPILVMSALVAFVIAVPQDLVRPDRGFIEGSTQAL